MCLAVALSKYPDIETVVYEAAGNFQEVGAGVMLWGRTWRILTLLGLDKAFRDLAGVAVDGSQDPPFNWTYRRSDMGSEGYKIDTVTLPSCPMHNYHRAHVLELLAGMLPEDTVKLGKRVASYQRVADSSLVAVTFADGSVVTCDVLVGCDGIRSVVRRYMFESLAEKGLPEMKKYIEPVWTGETLYRALIPSEHVSKLGLGGGRKYSVLGDPLMYCGKNKHFMGYPIGRGKWANVGGFDTHPEAAGTLYSGPWVQESSSEELRGVFAGWESELQEVLKSIEKPTKWAIHQLQPLPTYTSGPVALLGDAAHAMTTHHASGAGQAFEDAYILAGVLGHPSVTRRSISLALKAYEHIRLPSAADVMSRSGKTGPIYEFRSPDSGDDHTSWISALRKQFDWIYGEDPAKQLKSATEWMAKQQLASSGRSK
ncbi:uncharacterized protein PHACADRAFT_257977, partial [Phanerochaete carnosa HHB-10118-sp]